MLNAEITHHGIEGMRWGVRRYQNPDGSLTAAGKKKQEVAEKKTEKQNAKKDSKWIQTNTTKEWINAHNSTLDSMNDYLNKLNKKWEGKPATAEYYNDYAKEYAKQMNKVLNGGVTLPSGNLIYNFKATTDGSGRVNWQIEKLKHSDEEEPSEGTIELKDVVYIKNGVILRMKQQYLNHSLTHHGIEGMRWGVRRYQNPDGSLTAAGKKKAAQESGDYKAASKIKTKPTSSLSNQELRQAIERMNLEQQYKNLSSKQTSAGSQFVKGVVKEVGKELFKEAIKSGVRSGGKYVVDDLIKKNR